MIPNQGRWLTVTLCALLSASGCAEGSQNPNPIVGLSGGRAGGTAGTAGGTATAGASSPGAGAGGASAAGTGTAGSANTGGGGGTGAGIDAGLDAATSKPPQDGAIDDDASDAGVDDPTAVEWSGTTSQRRDMNFVVTDAGLTELRLQYAFPPVCDGDNTVRFDPPEPLGDPFSVAFQLMGTTNATFSGTFAPDGRTASGRVSFMTTLMPGQAACGTGVITWNATRD